MIVDFGKDYELIDTGDFEKLERFGQYILRRPEPQAIWPKALPDSEWQRADAWFELNEEATNKSDRGTWHVRKGMSDKWFISYSHDNMKLTFRLGMTSFKHVGLFPEQANNWNYIYDHLNGKIENPEVLNLFAYTGGATLAAKAAGADVTHLDAVKQVVNWAHDNMDASHLDNVRWMVEDAMTYVERAARRGKRYHAIILDPPAYGRGPKGEKWIFEEAIAPLMKACSQLLYPTGGMVILNLYSMGFSPLVAENLLHCYFPQAKGIECDTLSFRDRAGRTLPLSVFARFSTL